MDNLLSSIDSFEHYLRNNKNVSEINKIETLKFIICVKKMLKMKLGEIQESDPEINDIINLTQNSIFGYWFKEKLEELNCKIQINTIK